MKMNMPAYREGPSWYVIFRYQGKRYRRRCPISTKAAAKEFELRLLHRLMMGEPIDDDGKQAPTFSEFSRKWVDVYVRANNKPSEVENKCSVLRNHILPFFGEMPIDCIKREKIEEYKALKIAASLSPKTVNNHLAFIAKCLNCAVDWEEIELKDMPKIKKLTAHSKRIEFLSPAETAQLLTDRSDPMWNLMIYVALRTGLRFGELLGLRWEAINFEQKVLTVQESVVRGITGTPKSGRIRHIPIADDLHEALLLHRETRGRVFARDGYENLSSRMATNALRRIRMRVGMRHTNWHMFRHTFASHLAMNGTPIPVIQKFMGHASIEMTMRYAHLSPNAHADSVNCFRAMEKTAMQPLIVPPAFRLWEVRDPLQIEHV